MTGNNNANLKYTLLFGGGAIRGVAYCGALKVLEELGVQYDTRRFFCRVCFCRSYGCWV